MLLNLVFWIVRWIIKETLTPRHALKEFVQESVIYNSFRQILMHLSSYSLKGPWRKRIRGGTAGPPAWPPAYGVHDDALYKSTAFTFFTFLKPYPHWRLKRLKGDYSRQCGRGLSSILHNIDLRSGSRNLYNEILACTCQYMSDVLVSWKGFLTVYHRHYV